MSLTSKDLEQKLAELEQKSKIFFESLAINSKRERLDELKKQLDQPEIWSDTAKMAGLNKEKRVLESNLELYSKLESEIEELTVAKELFDEDPSIEGEAEAMLGSIDELVDKIEFQKMLGGKTDLMNAIVSINAGAGGRESQDWAVMLSRMYARWCERKGYGLEVIDKNTGDDANAIKNITFIAEGDYAYGYLKAEIGVHRLVRISPFDANKRRHTSFASVFVTPDRYIPFRRRRRSARQQNRLRNKDNPHPDRDRRPVPERQKPAQEQGDGDENPQIASLRVRTSEKTGGVFRNRKAEDRNRLREPDKKLCPSSLQNGQGSQNRF